MLMGDLWLTVLVLMTLWITKHSRSKRHQWKLAKKIPGPRGWPIFGNCFSLTGSALKTFNTFREWIATYGTTVQFWLGPKLYFLVTDPADFQIILGDPKIRNRDYHIGLAMKAFGDGLFSSRDDTWVLHRKLIIPAFHFKILESYLEIFSRKAEILCEKMQDIADGRTRDISHRLSLWALDAICETAIGTNMDVQGNESCEFEKAIDDALKLARNRLVYPWQLLEWLYPWTSDGRKARSVIQKFHNFSESVVASKLESYKKAGVKTISVTTGGDKKVSSFLDLLIDASASEGQLLTAEQIRDEVSTLAAAGMDTIAITMAHIFVLLGMHPEYQDLIDEELASIFQGDTRPTTPKDLHKTKMLEYVIKETLRLFPAATVFPREIQEDMEISNGYILPAGCSVMCFSYPTQRNPSHFPDPERFWPERWTPENSTDRHPYAFVPFSAGPRNCIGQKYAMLILKTTLICLLRRYRFACDCYTMKDLEQLELSVSLRSAVGYKVQIHKKNTC